MEKTHLNRRDLLTRLGIVVGTMALPGTALASPKKAPPQTPPFSYCLNTSTIMGQKLGLVQEIETAAQAGYDGIEIWIRSLEAYVADGGSLSDLQKRLDDRGLKVEDAIGFAPWIVDGHDTRTKALEQAKREMDLLAQIGCQRIAAPPAGATDHGGLDLDKAAERFRALQELGEEMGVVPQLEVWGFSQNLHKLSQVLYVAAEAGHKGTRILPDVYHLYKGGSDFDGLKLLSGHTVEIFHLNDYPAEPGRKEIGDQDRVYPGDGVAPVSQVLQDLAAGGGTTVLSLELFNRDYWAQDALTVAKTGLRKMKEAVAKAGF
jgi:2-keto-myo-inositol isomerase